MSLSRSIITLSVGLLLTVPSSHAAWISDGRFNWSWNKNERAKEFAQAGYGKPLTIDPKETIKNDLRYLLKDAMTAQYDFQPPRKGFMMKFAFTPAPQKYHFGYLVEVAVNSRNSFGAYEGFTKYIYLFRDNVLVEKLLDPATGVYGWDE
jgi:hypothetical protein